LKPKAIVWKGGNHEARLDWYCQRQSPELVGIEVEGEPVLTLPFLLAFKQRKILYVEPHWFCRHKALGILHGHEWSPGAAAPVNAARLAGLKLKECNITGHRHQSSQQPDRTMFDVSKTSWSVGCLCDLHPRYRTMNPWDHGFALLATKPTWSVRNFRIVNGQVV